MLRPATPDDLMALLDLERAANLAALGHVFPPDRHPFPDDDVLARWALVLEEPGVEVLVRDAPGDAGGALDVFVAYDERSLRLLAVHPRRWGTGLATAAIGTVLDRMAARGASVAELWCLEANARARRLYEHLGWRATGDARPAPWPPHPTEMRYARPLTEPPPCPAR